MEIMYGGYLVGLILSVALYCVPSMIALHRRHKKYTVIFLLNIFFGWTMVVWIICMIWAVFGETWRVPGRASRNKYEDLERLSRLKSSGDLTETEFQAEKSRILNQ